MLISCPRCGFSQPEDRFCAKCGVDMQNFKPTQPPAAKRFFSSTALQIIIIFLLAILAFYFVRESSRENMMSRVQFLKGGPVIAMRAKNIEVSPAKSTESQAQPQSESPPSPPPPAPPQAMQSASALTATPSNAMAPISEGVKVRIYFAEVDRSTMDALRQESSATGQFTEFGDFKAGALPANKKPTRERGVRILEKSEKKLDLQHLSDQWFNGVKLSSEQELGITTMISIDPPRGKILRGEIEVLRSFRESDDPNQAPVKRSYPTTSFELNSGMSWMISLNLPQNPQILPNEELDSSSFEGLMRIFQSPQYKSKQTEFTLFIEFDTPASHNAGKTHEQNGN